MLISRPSDPTARGEIGAGVVSSLAAIFQRRSPPSADAVSAERPVVGADFGHIAVQQASQPDILTGR